MGGHDVTDGGLALEEIRREGASERLVRGVAGRGQDGLVSVRHREFGHLVLRVRHGHDRQPSEGSGPWGRPVGPCTGRR